MKFEAPFFSQIRSRPSDVPFTHYFTALLVAAAVGPIFPIPILPEVIVFGASLLGIGLATGADWTKSKPF